VTGGNVSFYNQTGATPINPTPVVGVLGVIEDVTKRLPSGFVDADDIVLLVGETADELDGSEWAWVTHEHLGGRPPSVRFAAEQALSDFVRVAAADDLLTMTHDLSDGGLAQALAESVVIGGVGVHVTVASDAFVSLFSETTARAIVSCRDADLDRILAHADDAGVSVARLGRCGGDSLLVDGLFEVPITELRAAHEATLPDLFG
jgi:phosphoribosylformylglycinamidine synthase subunit PurL